jgi:hypothetical protein
VAVRAPGFVGGADGVREDVNGWNARPHPGPLALVAPKRSVGGRGEGESFAGSLEGRALELAVSHRAIRGRAKATPSPWGEGRDEGERDSLSQLN